MFGLRDKDKRDEAEFVIKSVALIVSAVWILLVGTAYLERQGKALDLRNKTLGIESNPTADTQISVNFANSPWAGAPNLCTVTGQYKIKNTGRLNFRIDRVSFEIYRLPVVSQQDLSPNEVTSITPAIRLRGLRPIHRETIDVGELVGVNNELQRNFGFIIRERPNTLYVVVANAVGGLPLEDGSGRFGERDLQYFSDVADICTPLAPSPPAPTSR
ncbi:MAG TPA: hypothetical protein VMS43_01770 [Allosphingosinicella sp.]|nr:hypothetical protein [Allosphingosinicella sp.]